MNNKTLKTGLIALVFILFSFNAVAIEVETVNDFDATNINKFMSTVHADSDYMMYGSFDDSLSSYSGQIYLRERNNLSNVTSFESSDSVIDIGSNSDYILFSDRNTNFYVLEKENLDAGTASYDLRSSEIVSLTVSDEYFITASNNNYIDFINQTTQNIEHTIELESSIKNIEVYENQLVVSTDNIRAYDLDSKNLTRNSSVVTENYVDFGISQEHAFMADSGGKADLVNLNDFNINSSYFESPNGVTGADIDRNRGFYTGTSSNMHYVDLINETEIETLSFNNQETVDVSVYDGMGIYGSEPDSDGDELVIFSYNTTEDLVQPENGDEEPGDDESGLIGDFEGYGVSILYPERLQDLGVPFGFVLVLNVMLTLVGTIVGILPNVLVDTIALVFSTLITIVLAFITSVELLTSLLSFLTNEGIELVKWFIYGFVGVKLYRYYQMYQQPSTTSTEMLDYMMDDIKDLSFQILDFAYQTYVLADRVFARVLDLLRTVASYIPFI